MRFEEFLAALARLAKEKGLSEPFLVGGYPRDRMLGLLPSQVKDIDVTTGDNSITALAMVASHEWPTAHFQSFEDGHSALAFKNIKVDFSNNFNLPGIEDELRKRGMDDPSSMQRELFSRDFTVNCLLQPLDLSKDVLDLTGKAKDDLRNRILRTPVDAEMTIGHDPRRILRAAKMSLKFGFEIDDDLAKAMVKYRGAVSDLPFSHVKKQVNQMLRLDPRKAIETLSEYKLLPMLPISRLMAMELAKHRMVQHLLDGS